MSLIALTRIEILSGTFFDTQDSQHKLLFERGLNTLRLMKACGTTTACMFEDTVDAREQTT